MVTLNNAISPGDGFEVERAISYLVSHYDKSGNNPKPVILHSLRVALALLEMGYDKKIVIGAILHDLLEDTDVTESQLKEKFGQDMLDLVMAVSYDTSITDPIELYKDMFDRIIAYGRDAVVLKAIDIAVNSLYIHLVLEREQQCALVEKGAYFLNLSKQYSAEPAWQLLKERNLEEFERLS